MRGQALDKAQRRIAWIRLGGLAVCGLLMARAAHLTVYNDRADRLFVQQINTEQRLPPSRGAIVDRDGRELALTIRSASVYAVPKLMKDRTGAARIVADTLGLDRARVAKRLAEHESFTYLARWVDPAKAEKLRALDIEGIGIDPEPRRSYPAGKLAAAVIGFANIDGKGVRGVEQIENEWLSGRPRTVHVQRDARGRTLALQASDPREVEGGEVALTLDSAMQAAAEAALADTVAERGAKGGLVLTLDPKNGDVLALAEAPGFDPNRFRELDYAETRSRTFSDVVEAGSTMKVFLAASALDNGDIDETMLFDTGDGSIRVPGKTIKDRDPFGIVTAADVLRVSSNVGAVQIAQRMGAEAQHRGLERFGFGQSTGSGFPTEERGLLRPWKRWRPVDQATVAFGQGVSVTPIQLGVALAALANDGMRMQPRIVLARRRDGGRWQPTEVREAGRAISPIAARKTLDMMQTVVSPTGTGRLAGLAGVAVAGKTGTAQKLDRELGRYSQSKYIAWFIGAVPADDPELVIVVAVDEPKGYLHTGGMVAAPLFARVAAAQLARRNIITEPAPIAPPPPPTLVAQADGTAAPATAPVGAAPAPSVAAGNGAPVASAAPASAPARPTAQTPDVAAGPPGAHDVLPRPAADAAPPARPAASPAAGHRPSPVVARVSTRDDAELDFVPDFVGQTLSVARRLAASKSLTISANGAPDGRVVSQIPVAGTVLQGANRTIRLRFATTREEG
ncbi:MAG: penicillin-binding transpeptidase domain-containing protein [Myxococcota bacterium]